MIRTSRFLLILSSLFFVTVTHAAPSALVPAAPDIGANAYLLMDYHSGFVLAEKNADERVEPASLTKLMTAYVVFYEIQRGSIKLEDQVKISKKAWRMGGSRMFVEVDTLVPVSELLKGMIVQSGNDATVALAEHAAGSEDAFATLMNKHAATLGMDHTNFVNSSGWPDDNHYTTARDLALLSRAIIRDFPDYYAWYSIKEFTYNNIRQSNRNRLLWMDERVDGLKTGHTDAAGYCLITSAKQEDMRLVSVVLGTSSENTRAVASRQLINYGFRFYETYKQHDANQALTQMRVWKGAEEQIQLGLASDLYVTAPRGTRNRIKADMQVEAMIEAPVKKGQGYGEIKLTLNDQVLVQRPLVALNDVEEGGLWRSLVDNVILIFK